MRTLFFIAAMCACFFVVEPTAEGHHHVNAFARGGFSHGVNFHVRNQLLFDNRYVPQLNRLNSFHGLPYNQVSTIVYSQPLFAVPATTYSYAPPPVQYRYVQPQQVEVEVPRTQVQVERVQAAPVERVYAAPVRTVMVEVDPGPTAVAVADVCPDPVVVRGPVHAHYSASAPLRAVHYSVPARLGHVNARVNVPAHLGHVNARVNVGVGVNPLTTANVNVNVNANARNHPLANLRQNLRHPFTGRQNVNVNIRSR